jgi:hypothetical protein
VAVLAAQLDALDREQRACDADTRRTIRSDLDELADSLHELNDRCELLARAALIAAGFRQHNRGEWRRKRDHQTIARPALDPADGGGEAGGPAAHPERG